MKPNHGYTSSFFTTLTTFELRYIKRTPPVYSSFVTRCSFVFFANFEQISHIVLVFP